MAGYRMLSHGVNPLDKERQPAVQIKYKDRTILFPLPAVGYLTGQPFDPAQGGPEKFT
jgi:hypothetical protein